jgi:hypothetical protein
MQLYKTLQLLYSYFIYQLTHLVTQTLSTLYSHTKLTSNFVTSNPISCCREKEHYKKPRRKWCACFFKHSSHSWIELLITMAALISPARFDLTPCSFASTFWTCLQITIAKLKKFIKTCVIVRIEFLEFCGCNLCHIDCC